MLIVEVLDREVHRYGERSAVPSPDIRLEERLSKDPERETADEARGLHLRDELERRYETALRVPPPHQRLDSGQLSARHLDHRLEVQDELVVRDGALQLEALHSCPSQSVPFLGTSRPRWR